MPQLSETFDLVSVASGARSLRSLEHGETFHPVVGPMAEARELHVRQQRLAERARAADGEFVIWDVGLGAAANAIAALEALAAGPRVCLHSFDVTTAPLFFALTHADALGYLTPFAADIAELLKSGRVRVGGNIDWQLHVGDFRTFAAGATAPAPHAIFYDPYSPRSNPELWTLGHFTTLRGRLDPSRGALWSNYTRSTAVRVTLLLAGFYVGRGIATGEKEETTLASLDPNLLAAPLDATWLGRVERSTAAAPLRSGGVPGPIADADLATLRAHPQFS